MIEKRFTETVEGFRKAGTMESLMEVLKVINDMITADVQVVTPIELPENFDGGAIEGDSVELKHLTMDGKTEYLVAFTSMDEHKKGPEGAALFVGMKDLVETALSAQQVDGIVINPWSSSFIFKKELMDIIEEMNEAKSVRASQVEENFYVHAIDEKPLKLIETVKKVMPEFENVNRVFLTGLNNNGKESYLLMIDFEGEEPDSLFGKLLGRLPGGDNGLGVDMTPYTVDYPGVLRLIYERNKQG